MIIVRLKGGFANQLFQYAAGRSLAIAKGTELFLDLSYLESDPKGGYTKRNFELGQIHSQARLATSEQLAPFQLKGGFDRFINKLGFRRHLVFNESSMNFMPLFDSLPDNVLLNGYWQSERYFSRIRPQLLQEISPNYGFTDKGKETLEKIDKSPSVAVHVRRGDYVSLQSAASWHGLSSLEYYTKASQQLLQKFKDLHFFVFSDDVEWCQQNLNFLPHVLFVEDESGKKSSQDLFIMSRCRHLIIANSSYSWWAAWLAENPETVIAPSNWYRTALTPADLYPPQWLKIQ